MGMRYQRGNQNRRRTDGLWTSVLIVINERIDSEQGHKIWPSNGSFWVKRNQCRHFFIAWLYLCCISRGCMCVGGGGGGEGVWDPINRNNLSISFRLYHAMNWMYKAICCGLLFLFNDLKREVVVRFVDVREIVDYHCWSFLLIISQLIRICHMIFFLWNKGLVHRQYQKDTSTRIPYHFIF